MTEQNAAQGRRLQEASFRYSADLLRGGKAQVLIILTFDPAIEQLAALIRLAAEVMLKLLGRAEREEGPGRK